MNMLKEGDQVPAFTTKDQDGNEVQWSDYADKKVVVFFYPKALITVLSSSAKSGKGNSYLFLKLV